MKVLWFTNTPSLADDYLKIRPIGGSWIASLEAAVSDIPEIELAVSFNISNREMAPFRINRTLYFPVTINKPIDPIKKLISYWRKSLENENNVQPYVDVIKEFQPDIIHIFGTEGPFGLLIPHTKIPCVIHIQGILTICDQKWYSGISEIAVMRNSKKSDLIKGTGIFHNYFMNKKKAKREREIYNYCKYFMGRTDWDRRVCSVLAPKARYFHCEETLRSEFFLHKWTPENNSGIRKIISVIKGNIFKGFETIVECKRILATIDLGFKIIWNVAGIRPTDEIVNLTEKKYSQSLKQLDLHLLGHLQQRELINEMIRSDIFIHPSHIENSSNSIGEAMLLGMPIIATFAGGIPTTIENNKEGILVQDGDPYALAGAIIELLKNNDLAKQLSLNARNKAATRHDPKKITSELLGIYSTILSE